MRHEPDTLGNCALCSRMFTGGRRRLVLFPCATARASRLAAENATLREQIRILVDHSAGRTSELLDECEHLRARLAQARRVNPRGEIPFPALLEALAYRCVDLMERRH